MMTLESYHAFYADTLRYRLTSDQESALLAHYKNEHDFEARGNFVLAQFSWLCSLFYTTFGLVDQLFDLIDEGVLDLLELVEKYDPSHESGAGFRTYCRPVLLHRAWVRLGGYKDGFAVSESGRKRSIYLNSFYNRCLADDMTEHEAMLATVRAYYDKYSHKRFDNLSPEGKRQAWGMVSRLLQLGTVPASLDAVGARATDSMGGSIADSRPGPEEDCLAREEKARLIGAVNRLPANQRAIIVQYFGLDGVGTRNLSQIARDQSVSRQRISHLFALAIVRLRAILDDVGDGT